MTSFRLRITHKIHPTASHPLFCSGPWANQNRLFWRALCSLTRSLSVSWLKKHHPNSKSSLKTSGFSHQPPGPGRGQAVTWSPWGHPLSRASSCGDERRGGVALSLAQSGRTPGSFIGSWRRRSKHRSIGTMDHGGRDVTS